jgi:hypothetical protein
MKLLSYMSWKNLAKVLVPVALLLAIGRFAFTKPDPNAPPFELTRAHHSSMGWNTGTGNEWWTYDAEWRGRELSINVAPENQYPGQADGPEAFDSRSYGYALGKSAFSGNDSKQRVAAEALLLQMGWNDNTFRWFLVKESGGKLEATWLTSDPVDLYSIWQIWNADQPKKASKYDEDVYSSFAELGLLRLHSFETKMALPAQDFPRFLLVGRTALLEVATLQVHHLPASDSYRSEPLGLSQDGEVLMFFASKDIKDNNDKAYGIEQIAWRSGEVRWLPMDMKQRHLRHTSDINRAWRDAALEWKAEKPGATRWAHWREKAKLPNWTGRLTATEYTLEGYLSALIEPALNLLKRELHATVSPYVPEYPLASGEMMYRGEIAGSELRIGYSKEHGLTVSIPGSLQDQAKYRVLAQIAATLDNALRAGQWQEFVEP